MMITGSNQKRLSSLSQKHGIKHELCQNLSEAVQRIALHLQENEVALLSPAAASLDEFTSYAARGDLFKKEVSELQ